jgi:4-hydroxy-3-methylbut-2-enyl diphosphate reductase IspH
LLAHETVAVTWWASTPKEDIEEVIDFFVANGYEKEILFLKG